LVEGKMKDQEPDSPYGVICKEHGKQGLTKKDYNQQMARPDSFWICPVCRDIANWDDDRYEAAMDAGRA
jgi:hypothetical protein